MSPPRSDFDAPPQGRNASGPAEPDPRRSLDAVSGVDPSHWRAAGLALGCFVLLAGAGWLAPKWLTFLVTMAAGNGLVSLGIVGLMRGGVVPFGQGMVFAIGGYAAALLFNKLGFTDALGLALAGGVMATLIAAPFAPLLSRYRGIFFAKIGRASCRERVYSSV